MASRWVMLQLLGTLACDQAPERKPEDLVSAAAKATAPGSVCTMPAQPTTILERDGAIREIWAFRLEQVVTEALPEDAAFLAYRAAIERDGADVVRPVADPPIVRTDEEAEMWRFQRLGSRTTCIASTITVRYLTRRCT